MRKYFLLSAVAALVASTANATTDYAEVTARATIQVAGTVNCTDMDFGTIVVKSGRADDTVVSISAFDNEITFDTAHVLSVTGASRGECYPTSNDYVMKSSSSTVLTNQNGDTLSLVIESDDFESFGGSLTIPADVNPGTYTGLYTVTYTY